MNYLGSEIEKISARKKVRFFGLCNLLLMGQGQAQQQHPDVCTRGVSRGKVCGCGC